MANETNRPEPEYNGPETLTDLSRAEGEAKIAQVIRVSVRAFRDKRSGHTAITVDDLYELSQTFPTFDIVGCVLELGKLRVIKARTPYQLQKKRAEKPR